MAFQIFSWQQDDYKQLLDINGKRVVFVHGQDIASPYHVFAAYINHLNDTGHSVFLVSKNNLGILTPLFPFLQAVTENAPSLGMGTGIAKSIIKDLTQSDTLAQLVENISGAEKRSSFFLNSRENDLMILFNRAVNNQIPVFVFCGYPSFDTSSHSLTKLLLSAQLNLNFPFLDKAKYIFICDLEDDSTNYKDVKIHEHIDITLTDPDVNNMDEILAEISPALELQSSEKSKLFHLSGGHLSVIEILIRYLAENDVTPTASTPQEVVNLVLEDRLEHMGNIGDSLKSVLETAATIGETFPLSLLKKAAEQIDVCDLVLKKSNEEFLTTCIKEIGKFKYTEIWEYFADSAFSRGNTETLSSSIAEAIYFFNPYDYIARAHHLERANKPLEACELYFLAYNLLFQESIIPHEELVSKIDHLARVCGITDYWIKLQEYYRHAKHLNFQACFETLDAMPLTLTTRMMLLKEYLLGICIYRTSDSSDDTNSAIIAVEKTAQHAKDIEVGLWCDCQMILISFTVNLTGDIAKARSISKELAYFYTNKIHAPFAQKGLCALERKYSALYSVERAVVKTQRSVEFFRNSSYPAQYLMALNNHAANLIVLGRFDESMTYLIEASEFLKKNVQVNVNLMYLVGNYCLCAVLLEKLPPKTAYEKIAPLLEGSTFADWKFITKLNCSIYLAKSGDLNKAEILLISLEMLAKQLNDDYYLYYVHANLSAVYYLQGHTHTAVSLLEKECMSPPNLLKETEKAYLKERTIKWAELMKTQKIADPMEFDSCLLLQHPPESQWSFTGRGFLYSDIQFWSEP